MKKLMVNDNREDSMDEQNESRNLRNATLGEIAKVPFAEFAGAAIRFSVLVGAAVAVGLASGSFCWGLAAFLALCYLGMKID